VSTTKGARALLLRLRGFACSFDSSLEIAAAGVLQQIVLFLPLNKRWKCERS
jgi:hypothetical protein